MFIIKKYRHPLILLTITILSFQLYYQGVNGPFLYDDESNLQTLGWHSGIDSVNDALNFIFSNLSGPLGRPVSMFSFLFNATNWPADSNSFKLTNIIIHLLCGWLIFLFCRKFLELFEGKSLKPYASLLALITACFWLLHPLHVSTTLYIIQRMTLLSAFFTLLALVGYLQMVKSLVGKNKVWEFIFPTAFLILTISLAVFSKENAILIFPAILLIQSFIDTPARSRMFNVWFYSITFIPIMALLLYFVVNHQLFTTGYQFKGYNGVERLLTETRVLSDYIFQILVPNSDRMTLFHDDFMVSRSPISPISTLPSIILLACLAGFLFTRIPKLYKFSISWFFIFHLLESTLLPLDLYFEHRNYLPAVGPLLALSYTFILLAKNIQFKTEISTLLLSFIYGLFLMFNLAFITKLWADEESLYMH